MRITRKGVSREGDGFHFFFGQTQVPAWPGESIAAALIAAGLLHCRSTREDEPRGVFCGMGVCGECAMLVDGVPRRACLEKARPDLRVEVQPPLRALPAASPEATVWGCAPVQRDVDVLVIGGGPAGLAAAAAAARAGADVLLLDERQQAGGQYFKQPGLGFSVDERALDAQFVEGIALFREAQAAGVEFLFEATVWGAFAGPQIAVVTPRGQQLVMSRRIVVSPGAYESPLPFPGWTLPGVMTTGAAQTLLRAYQMTPGKRVLVAGNGPLNLQVARELCDAGAEVVAMVELARRPGVSKIGDLARMFFSSPSLILDGIRHSVRLASAGVPSLYGSTVTRATGDECVREVTISSVDKQGYPVPGTEQSFDVDAVCLGYGFLPQSEIARALGAAEIFPRGGESPVLERDLEGRSASAPDVFVAGDARGLGGARVAQTQGSIAGAAAARDLGFTASQAGQNGREHSLLRRHWRFQRGLWSIYATPENKLALCDDDTILCRCESVRLGALKHRQNEGACSLGALKRATRAGMGRCQGRYCAGLLGQMLGHPAGRDGSPGGAEGTGDDSYFAPRPPFKPLTIGDLAAPYDPGVAFDRTAGTDSAE